MSIRYRPEIDGLRAVAVGSVMIYHLDLYVARHKILQGGFLGVDIFFVISGFLIASLIRKEYTETGRFSLLDFYERRARRLLPALFAVIAVAYVGALAILVPTAMAKFAESVLASIGFVSNIYWLSKSQVYGAHSGLIEPMLHTWSLAVEEQFYIVFPLLYVFVLSRVRRGLAWIGLGAIAGGLVLAEVLTRVDFTFSFYMLFSRIWELLCGVILAHALAVRPDLGRGLRFARVLPSLGLALIVLSLVLVPLNWSHPGFGTIGAVLGTVLIIWFADPKDITTRFLSWRVMLGIGLISYSLYLWHYPIYAFGRLLRLMDPGPVDYLIWITLTFAAATVTYFFVERPFRDRTAMPRPRLAGSLGVSVAAVAAVSSFVLTRQGLPERLAWLTPYYGIIEPDNEFLNTQSWDVLEHLAKSEGFDRSEAHEPSVFEKDHLWFDLAEPSRKVLIVGNSHSRDLFNALYLKRARFPDFQFARFGMHNMIWPEQVDALLAAPNLIHADAVMISFRHQNMESISMLPNLIEPLIAAGKQVALTSNSTEFEADDVYTLVDKYLRRNRTVDVAAINRMAWTARIVSADSRENRLLRALGREYGILYLEKEDYICDAEAEVCPMLTPDGKKIHPDYGHYTLSGAAYYGNRIAEIDWLGPLLHPRD